MQKNEGDKCEDCGAVYQRRPGDGGLLSVYHAATCKEAVQRPEPATEECAR